MTHQSTHNASKMCQHASKKEERKRNTTTLFLIELKPIHKAYHSHRRIIYVYSSSIQEDTHIGRFDNLFQLFHISKSPQVSFIP